MAPWTFTILCGARILFLGDSADLQHGAGAVNDDGQRVYGPNLWIAFDCWLKNTLPGFAKDELGHGLTGDTAFKGRYVIWRSQMDGGEGQEEQGQTWKKGMVRDLQPTPCSSQRPGLAGPRSGWDHLWGVVQSKGSGFGLTWVTPPLPVSRRVTLGKCLCAPGPPVLHLGSGARGAPHAKCSSAPFCNVAPHSPTRSQGRVDASTGEAPENKLVDNPSPIPPPPLPRAGGTSDRAPTHMVKYLTLGGAVLLGDGVGHCIRAHEQCVPVVRAESEAEQRGQTVAEWGQLFSDAKPVRNTFVGLPS